MLIADAEKMYSIQVALTFKYTQKNCQVQTKKSSQHTHLEI